MRPPQGIEWLVILVIVLLLFGGRKLPDMARGLGRSLRIFKSETREMADEDRSGEALSDAEAAVPARPEPTAVESAEPTVADSDPAGETATRPEPRLGS